MPDEKCSLCSQTEAWHKEHRPKHPFATEGQEIPPLNGATERKRREAMANAAAEERMATRRGAATSGPITEMTPSPTIHWPSDPVLRMILVEKGLITTDDLDSAEKRLRAISGGGAFVVSHTS